MSLIKAVVDDWSSLMIGLAFGALLVGTPSFMLGNILRGLKHDPSHTLRTARRR